MSDPTPKPATEPHMVDLPRNKVELFLEKNFKKIAIGCCLIALLIAAVGLARYFRNKTEMEAAQRFTSASTVEDYDIVIRKYAGTDAAGNAMLLKASLQWDEGKKESSIGTLQEFVKTQAKHLLMPHALLGLGTKQVSFGEKDAGRATLELLLKEHPKSEAAPGAQIALGDMLWADGQTDEARKIYEGLPRNYPGSPFLGQAEERLKMMDAGLPTVEVEPPPAPEPPAPSPETPSPTAPPAAPEAPAAPPSESKAPEAPAPASPAAPAPEPEASTPPVPAPEKPAENP